MNITIVTNTSDNIKALTDVTLQNKLGYASRHGYDVLVQDFDYQRFNECIVDLMRSTLGFMRESDVVMTMGADTMFTNWSLKVEDVLQAHPGKIVIAKEKTGWWPINDDVVIWPCTPKVIAFYERLIEDFPVWCEYPWRTQTHIWNLIQEDPSVKDLIDLVEPEIMNQHPTKWQLGNWIVHFYNMELAQKLSLANEFQANWPDGNPVWKLKQNSVRPGVI